jgi:hypothetical protein
MEVGLLFPHTYVDRDDVNCVHGVYSSRVGFVYDLKFQFKRTFPLPGEGWGLTHNQRSLIISDGSSNIFFMSPKVNARPTSPPVPSFLSQYDCMTGCYYRHLRSNEHLKFVK